MHDDDNQTTIVDFYLKIIDSYYFFIFIYLLYNIYTINTILMRSKGENLYFIR